MLDPGVLSADDVRQIRLALGLTQEDFAQVVGVTVGSVNRWEKGRFAPSRLATQKLKTLLPR